MIERLKIPSSLVVSVIIPCYNHGKYLPQAIESVFKQSNVAFEIVVVDDGSTDNTRDVVESYPTVKYVYQCNQGLSAARNTGIDQSLGDYLVFLDADDWLLNKALLNNLQYLLENKNAGFVSGGHKKVYESKNLVHEFKIQVVQNHYRQLLERNYIGMHAAVMYPRWVFDVFRYDALLKACEDYDLYLRIARKYPVIHHTGPIAAYRIHDTNMSGNIPLMLQSAQMVLSRQQDSLVNLDEKLSLKKGISSWNNFYCTELYYKLLNSSFRIGFGNGKEDYKVLWHRKRSLFLKFLITKPLRPIKKLIIKYSPAFLLRWLSRVGIYQNFIPPSGKIVMGDFNRTSPYSKNFGYDRGGPIDRYYIENFLQEHAAVIQGRVLEIGDNDYTLRFGGSRVIQSDILHVDDTNLKATFIGDLAKAPHLPDDSFDCIILTQTLHLIYHYKDALQTCYRILKPGGTLLLTVPGISHIDQGEWKDIWLWSFTECSITRILSEIFPPDETTVQSFGNVLAATAFLYGMGLSEIKKEQLDYTDPHYQVTITALTVKPNAC